MLWPSTLFTSWPIHWLHRYLWPGPTPFRLNKIIIYPKWWSGHQERVEWPTLNWMIQPAPNPIFSGESESEEGMIIASAEYSSREGHVTCSKWNDLYVIGCEVQMRHGIWWEILNVWSTAHARANLMIITTNRSTKPLQNMTYDISTGPNFYLDWGSEVEISIYHLRHVL